ncbi:MAG: bifunctional demethylmenaquinone methyltransferase/2-methoxy-6-polyprenyl-1,4-benzoquinol methylase UbiE [Planctomycetes bacterium]|nr:bifunctional demethylmenaquinone methyltransferase/2-methoxy-6-polyprenyl-1,4-benzoquinol methylase UbiE [Planctomycetota bacterium]
MADRTPVWTQEALQGNPHADAEKARKVQSMFAAIARSYDLNNRLHSFLQDQRWRRAAVRAAGVTGSTRVLDVACGTGDLAEAFADAGAREVIGVDFTPEMLDVARHKGAGRPESSRVTYRQGDAMRLDFADASFDVVSIAFGIRNVAVPERALGEFFRVLAPGGRLVVLEFADPANPLVRWGSNLYTKRIMPWTASLIARDGSGAYHYLPRSVSTFLQPADFARKLRAVGFDRCSATPLTLGICVLHRAEKPADAATLSGVHGGDRRTTDGTRQRQDA